MGRKKQTRVSIISTQVALVNRRETQKPGPTYSNNPILVLFGKNTLSILDRQSHYELFTEPNGNFLWWNMLLTITMTLYYEWLFFFWCNNNFCFDTNLFWHCLHKYCFSELWVSLCLLDFAADENFALHCLHSWIESDAANKDPLKKLFLCLNFLFDLFDLFGLFFVIFCGVTLILFEYDLFLYIYWSIVLLLLLFYCYILYVINLVHYNISDYHKKYKKIN